MIQNSRLELEYDTMTIAAIIDPDNAMYEFEDLNDEDWELIPGIWDDFEVVSEELIDYDPECSTVTICRYVKQKSTGKYFKGCLTRCYQDNPQYCSSLTQVFPEEELVTIYK